MRAVAPNSMLARIFLAFLATAEKPDLEEKREKKGFVAEVVEEGLRPVQVWVGTLSGDGPIGEDDSPEERESKKQIRILPARLRDVLVGTEQQHRVLLRRETMRPGEGVGHAARALLLQPLWLQLLDVGLFQRADGHRGRCAGQQRLVGLTSAIQGRRIDAIDLVQHQPAFACSQLRAETYQFGGNGCDIRHRVSQRPHIDQVQQQRIPVERFARSTQIASMWVWIAPKQG